MRVMRHVVVHHDDNVVVRIATPLEHLGTQVGKGGEPSSIEGDLAIIRIRV